MASFELVTLVRRLHHAIRARISEDLRARGYNDITPAHIYVFQTPRPDGVRPSELAQRTLMTKQAINHLLAGLEQRGYIERVGAEGDGRARVVRLTTKGHELTDTIQESAAEIQRRWQDALGSGRMHDLLGALERLDAIGPDPSPSSALPPTRAAR
jgi:DNA-binding MarR family transcriptional regulator